MNISRQWTATLTVSPGAAQSPPTAESIIAAIEQLDSQVDGEIALALVPDENTIGIAEALRKAEYPYHLVLPGEHAGLTGHDLSALQTSATSVNVPPVRGNGREHWSDCHTWLESVAEIRIVICDSADQPTDPDKPSLLIDPTDGSTALRGFPKSGLLTDPTYQATAKYLFGRLPPPETLNEVKKTASTLANRAAPRFRRLQTGSLFLNLAPAMIVACGSALLWLPHTVATWKFCAAFLAALFAMGLKRLSTKRLWLAARATAEICRSLTASNGLLDPLFSPAARFLPRHAALARSLALAHATSLRGQPRLPHTEFRDHYLQTRLAGQISYYEKHANSARRRQRWIRAAFYLFTSLAVVASSLALLGRIGWLPWLPDMVNDRWISGCATAVFPALAAAVIGYLSLTESSRRAGYYAELSAQLQERRSILARLASEASITEAIRETEGILLEEIAGWLRRQSF